MSRDELLQALRHSRSESGNPPAELGKRRMYKLFHAERRKQIKDCPRLFRSNHDHNSGVDIRLIYSNLKKVDTFVLSNPGAELEPEEFMNSKKSHEVQSMSEVVACLAKRCGVKQARRWKFNDMMLDLIFLVKGCDHICNNNCEQVSSFLFYPGDRHWFREGLPEFLPVPAARPSGLWHRLLQHQHPWSPREEQEAQEVLQGVPET